MSDTTLSLSTPNRQSLTEDWVSLGIGLFVLILALAGTAGPDLLGWVVSTSVWTDVTHALAPTAKFTHGSAAARVCSQLTLHSPRC
ncbi:MAG TPA: hypothetical protein VFE89_16255 [Beijerinckiaceae bacterium]|jgi:hypothetical protein|nr:hypothetical protein [Beijerinckiaceae bacterium]